MLGLENALKQVLSDYPRIFFACHRKHVQDPRTQIVVSAHQAEILAHLDEVDSITLSSLARHMGVTVSTMSLSVERLVRKKLVTRSRDAKDRRRLVLRLSPAGARIKARDEVLDREVLRRMLSRLSASEREEGVRGLAILARAAGEEIQWRKEERSS